MWVLIVVCGFLADYPDQLEVSNDMYHSAWDPCTSCSFRHGVHDGTAEYWCTTKTAFQVTATPEVSNKCLNNVSVYESLWCELFWDVTRSPSCHPRYRDLASAKAEVELREVSTRFPKSFYRSPVVKRYFDPYLYNVELMATYRLELANDWQTFASINWMMKLSKNS